MSLRRRWKLAKPDSEWDSLVAIRAATNAEPRPVHRALAELNERLAQLMTDYTALQADIASLGENIAAVQTAVQDLEAAHASEQAIVDQIDQSIKAANTALEGLFPKPATGAASIAVTLAPASLPADGTSQVTATATVTDASGNPLPSETIAFTSSDPGQVISATANVGAGVYTAAITATTTPGVKTIAATDGTVTATADLTEA